MLEVSRLRRSYGRFVAVDGVTFDIGQGEIVGLLGHNGAGKTTIMKMLSGYLEPDAGVIRVGDCDLATASKQVQRQLGYLPENLPVYPDMSVGDYLVFAAELKGLEDGTLREEVRRVVRATDIETKLLAPIATLSRGFRQRVGVAQAILGKPRLLILDEPTNGLDPTQTGHMRQLIRELSATASVILSTHIMQEVEAICDRVLILRAGKLAVDARLDQLRDSNSLRLQTSLAPDRALAILGAVDSVTAVRNLAGQQDPAQQVYTYRVTVAGTADKRAVGAALSRAVSAAAADLFSLQVDKQDLETLFRQVSSTPGPAGVAQREEALTDAA